MTHQFYYDQKMIYRKLKVSVKENESAELYCQIQCEREERA